MNKRLLISGVACILLAGTTISAFLNWQHANERIKELETQLSELQRQENRSAVIRSISKQMEEIAYQQKAISDEQREEAIMQTRVAEELRAQSEKERLNAIEAEKNAVASQKRALEASNQAEQQRILAEHQRMQAEFSKRKADTLSYIALGRSLGSIATLQSQTGNQELANMLSYASYVYTHRYRGDIYHPAIFKALMDATQSKRTWQRHVGAAMSIIFSSKTDDQIISASSYGEIMINKRQDNTLHSTLLFSDKSQDIRDIFINQESNKIYAISRTGNVIVISADRNPKKTLIIPTTGLQYPFALSAIKDKRYLLVIGEHGMGLFDMSKDRFLTQKSVPFRITACSRRNYLPLIFDDKGYMHLVNGIDNYTKEQIPVPGIITAFAESKNTGYSAYGTKEGIIYLIKPSGMIQKLVAHRSRISKLKLNGRRLYSSSYDGTVNLWITDNDKIDAMQLFSTEEWILSFNFDSSKNTIWTGDIKGNLTAATISVPMMIEKLKSKLKRNFTQEEWNFFIGENVPYEDFMASIKREKEDKP